LRRGEVADEADRLVVLLLVAAVQKGCAAPDITSVRGHEQRVSDSAVERRIAGQEIVLVGVDRRDERGLAALELALEVYEPPPAGSVIGGDLVNAHDQVC